MNKSQLIAHLCLIVSLCFPLESSIQNIPQKDIKKIESFFEDLIKWHDFAYPIFGSKPMSLADYNLKVPGQLPFYKKIRSWFRLTKRKDQLEAWYKYKNEFELNEFIFLDEEKDLFNCLALILINQKNMLQLLKTHEAIFKEELGDSFTPESFLETLKNRKLSLGQATKNNQKLLGIMLGYGVRNATLFQERYHLMKKITQGGLAEINELTDKLNRLEEQVGNFSELEEDASISPLYFLADRYHPETMTLKKQYELDRQNIEHMQQKPHFMDTVLQRLAI